MIDFSNATVLSYAHTPKFLGETLRYAVVKNITVEGYLLNLSNSEGVSGIYQDISQILSGVNDYDAVMINGVNLGQGKVTDFNFLDNDSNQDVMYKKYEAALEIYSSGNLFNVFSDYYSGLTWQNAPYLDSFNESFSYTRNDDNSSQYEQDISVRFNSGNGLPDTPINLGRVFASGFFASLNLTGFLGLSYNKGYKNFYTETYNQIDSLCSFKRAASFPAESGNYAIDYKHQLELDENGIINVSEEGKIQGLYDPIYTSLQSGITIEIPNSFARCSGVFNFYAPSGAYPLNINPIKKNTNINKFEGTADFSILYTNDPRYWNVYAWEYTTTIDVSQDRVYTVVENGKVDGIGRRLIDKYPNAQIGYAIVKTGVANRLGTLYSGVNPYPLTLNMISKVEGFSNYEGVISYAQTFSDDITLFPASGIRKFEIAINDKIPVQAVNKFNIVGVKELIQPTYQSTLGERNISVNMIGNRNLPISSYLSFASGKLANYRNLGTDIWTSAAPYEYDPLVNTFNLNVVYNYDGVYKSFTDIVFSASGIGL